MTKKINKIIWVVIVVLPTAVFALAAALHYRPGAYQPPAPPGGDAISPYLTHQLAPTFFNQMQLEQPFELVITQEGFNEILACWQWPRQIGTMTVGQPYIVFGNRYLDILCPISYRGWLAFVSVAVEPKLGSSLRFKIHSIRLGAVPVTYFSLPWLRHFWQAYEPQNDDPIVFAVLDAALSQKPLEPAFELFGYQLGVEKITVQKNQMILQLTSRRKRG